MNPQLISVYRERVALEATVPRLIELNVPSQGCVRTVLIKQVGAAAATITANLYDREDAGVSVAVESSNPDDGVVGLSPEVHRVIATITGTGGKAEAFSQNGYYLNSDEKPEYSACELNKLWLELTGSVTGDYDIAVTVSGIY